MELQSKHTAPNRIIPVTATIDVSASATVSLAVNLQGGTLCGFILPATFTGTALSFQVAESEGGTYRALYDTSGNAVSYTVAQATATFVNPSNFACAQFLKVVSGSTEGADREIILLVRKID